MIRALRVLLASLLLLPTGALAADNGNNPSTEDSHSTFYGTPYYSAVCDSSGNAGISISGGSLPSVVPQPYNGIFTAAGNKFDVAPAFVAAVFYGGEHGNSFPEPPPPYGHGSPWATSDAGANGPMQFLVSTWRGFEQDGNGDGKKDIQDLTDAAFGGAAYLAYLGAKGTVDEGKLRKAAADYNGIHAPYADYPNQVWKAFEKFGGGSGGGGGGSFTSTGGGDNSSCATGGATGDVSGYRDPLRDIKNLVRMRIDMGVDYGGHGPYYAIGKGKVTVASATTGWPGGNFVAYQLSEGPAKGKYIYVAEHCDLKVKTGDVVDSNTVLCDLQEGSPWSETGWAVPPEQGTTAAAHTIYNEGDVTAYGVNFSQFMVKIGSKPGTSNTAHPVGSLPDGWPSWR